MKQNQSQGINQKPHAVHPKYPVHYIILWIETIHTYRRPLVAKTPNPANRICQDNGELQPCLRLGEKN